MPVILRIRAFIKRYAALNLEDDQKAHLPGLASSDGRLVSVEVPPDERFKDESGSGFEPGQIVIVAERLMSCFDLAELRARVAELTEKAVEKGEREAAGDDQAARDFLNELAIEP